MTTEKLILIHERLARLTRRIQDRDPETKQNVREEGEGFPYIEVNEGYLRTIIPWLRTHNKVLRSFCDLGCGAAAMCTIAELIGYKWSFGVELNETLASIGPRIIHGNLLKEETYVQVVSFINRTSLPKPILYYSYSPIETKWSGLNFERDNYDIMFKNLERIMGQKDRLLFVTIHEKINIIAEKYFNKSSILRNGIRVYKKK